MKNRCWSQHLCKLAITTNQQSTPRDNLSKLVYMHEAERVASKMLKLQIAVISTRTESRRYQIWVTAMSCVSCKLTPIFHNPSFNYTTWATFLDSHVFLRWFQFNTNAKLFQHWWKQSVIKFTFCLRKLSLLWGKENQTSLLKGVSSTVTKSREINSKHQITPQRKGAVKMQIISRNMIFSFIMFQPSCSLLYISRKLFCLRVTVTSQQN